MTDPFEILRAQLVEAARRVAASPRPRHGRGPDGGTAVGRGRWRC